MNKTTNKITNKTFLLLFSFSLINTAHAMDAITISGQQAVGLYAHVVGPAVVSTVADSVRTITVDGKPLLICDKSSQACIFENTDGTSGTDKTETIVSGATAGNLYKNIIGWNKETAGSNELSFELPWTQTWGTPKPITCNLTTIIRYDTVKNILTVDMSEIQAQLAACEKPTP